MAYVAITDIINPEVLADQVAAKFPDMLAFVGTSVVNINDEFPLGSPGTEFKMPFWKRGGSFAAMTEGTPLVPGKVTTGSEFATVLRAGIAYENLDTALLVSIPDPMAEMAGQLSRRLAEYLDDSLITKANLTPNLYDQSVNGAGTLTADAIITAAITALGDNHSKLMGGSGALIMHSKPYGDLMKLGLIQNMYQAGMDVVKSGQIPTLLGMPIIISDRVTTTTVSGVVYYNTYIAGPDALGLYFQRLVNVETFRDILLKANLLSADVHFAPHLYGWDDKTNAQVAEDAKSILMVKIKSK